MKIIRTHAFARAGLIGNPSDGYNGKTISIIIRDYAARVVLYEWPTVEIVWSQDEHSKFDSVHELVRDVRLHGYYGGIRLVKATIKRFVEACEKKGYSLHDRTFSIRYESNIPRQVGMAGSSAIIVATLRALMQFYGVEFPLEVQPSLALDVERRELGISAGLQDRVIQIYEGAVYMDFARDREQTDPDLGLPFGIYERLKPGKLPPLYVAYSTDVGEPTYVVHNPLRARYESGDQAVVRAMDTFADLTVRFLQAMHAENIDEMSRLIDENFNTRRSICNLNADHVAMIEAARSTGASAKFAGSGGAIIGVCRDDTMFASLQAKLQPLGCKVIRPTIVS
ncbi:MAG: mevalonate kinase [Planctomycetaceae bacterium]